MNQNTLTQQWPTPAKTPKITNKTNARRQILQTNYVCGDENEEDSDGDMEYDMTDDQIESFTQQHTTCDVDDEEGNDDDEHYNWSQDLSQELLVDDGRNHKQSSYGGLESHQFRKNSAQISGRNHGVPLLGEASGTTLTRIVTDEVSPPAKKQKFTGDTVDTFYCKDYKGVTNVYKVNEAFRHRNERIKVTRNLIYVITGKQMVGMKKYAICRIYRPLKDTFIGDQVSDCLKSAYVILHYSKNVLMSNLVERLKNPPKEILDTKFRIYFMDIRKTIDNHMMSQGKVLPKGDGFNVLYTVMTDEKCNLDLNLKRPTVLDVFAGAGGMSEGFTNAGFDLKWAVEKDQTAASTFRNNLGDNKNDVFIFRECVRKWLKKGFSPENRNGGKNDKANNELSLFCIEIVKHFLPKTVSFENVTGMAHEKNVHYLKKVVADLIELGYSVRVQITNSKHYGDPQARHRLFINAARGQLPLADIPTITHGCGEGLDPIRTVSDAIGNLVDVPPDDGDGRVTYFEDNCEYLTYNHSVDAIKTKAEEIPLVANKPTPTIKRCANLRHYLLDRCLTVREMARLFSFDDSFEFTGTCSQQVSQIGNAVPVKLATAVAKAILRRSYPQCHVIEDVCQ